MASSICSNSFNVKTYSQVLTDPLLEEIRSLRIVDDFMALADLVPRNLTTTQIEKIQIESQQVEIKKGRVEALKFLLAKTYRPANELKPVSLRELDPKWTIESIKFQTLFNYIEKTWVDLIRKTPKKTKSTLIPLPNPMMIPGSRFKESYYWDSFFAMPTLLKTGRSNIVKMTIDNFLFLVKKYGFVPNGNREYYLSRSQPPFLSQMIRLYIEHQALAAPLDVKTMEWLRKKAYPLVKAEYQKFWMNPKTRYDIKTALNHHYDDLNTPRPERHSTDADEVLAKTFRDARAEAESGKDFTDAFGGEATQVAGVLLNSVLFQVEHDLLWMARLLDKADDARHFEQAAEKRKLSMNTYLWDEKQGGYFDFNLRSNQKGNVLTADIYAPMYVGAASPEQARSLLALLPMLERKGGIASSNISSGKQWDFPYGWAPHHFMSISGLLKYGYINDATRLGEKWVESNLRIYEASTKLIEKIDVVTGSLPEERGDKYPTQEGFLWTNGVVAWVLTDVLGIPLVPLESRKP